MKYLLKVPGIFMKSAMKYPEANNEISIMRFHWTCKHYTHRPPGRCLVFIIKVVTTHQHALLLLYLKNPRLSESCVHVGCSIPSGLQTMIRCLLFFQPQAAKVKQGMSFSHCGPLACDHEYFWPLSDCKSTSHGFKWATAMLWILARRLQY